LRASCNVTPNKTLPPSTRLLVLVYQAVLDDVHERGEVWQDAAAHEDRDLLHALDARVARLRKWGQD